jgi:hydroxypyruvate isomerase
MKSDRKLSRREALHAFAGFSAAGAALPPVWSSQRPSTPRRPKSRIKQSVCRWCYQGLSIEQLAAGAARIGLKSVELIGPEEFQVVKQYGLTCAVTWGTGPIHDCLNRVENHDRCERELKEHIEFAAAEKIPNVICFSGNRNGMPDDQGLENCVLGIKRAVGFAEKMKVTIVLEMLNSKVNHKDYMADRTGWAVEVAKKVGSPRFKLLYDIYHMQIMEGDVIQTIRDHKEYFAHYHTGGVPGRNEIDQTQELNYPAIVRAILETGYDGYLGQEYIPTRDPLTSLEEGVRICDV